MELDCLAKHCLSDKVAVVKHFCAYFSEYSAQWSTSTPIARSNLPYQHSSRYRYDELIAIERNIVGVL